MAHFHIDYSANLESVIDISGLCEAIRNCAAGMDCFPTAGVRVRALRVDYVSIADGNPNHGFIDLSVRLRAGRSPDVKKAAIAEIFETLKSYTAGAMDTHSIAISAEMRDIDAELAPKFGNIRDHMEG
ncbi:MAG: 5-carboxymethyl-2-hydroxymuconate isomerase [Candidatus Puniceispirillaceae bacterium]